MSIGDLVYLKPRNNPDDEDYIGLIVHFEHVGAQGRGGTVLYDVLMTAMDEVITVSDIYFEIWRVE